MARILPTDEDADYKMMLAKNEWPIWPCLALKRGERFPREHAKLFEFQGKIWFIDGTVFDSISSKDLKDENIVTPEKARELVDAGWRVD